VAHEVPAAGRVDWLAVERMASRQGPRCGWLERGTCIDGLKQECPRGPNHESLEVLMSVIIGVDPHKATHTAVAIDRNESEVARAQGPSDAQAGPAATAVG